MVACELCGMKFDVTARAFRNYQAGRRKPRCVMHREQKPRPETRALENYRWWVERFTDAEIWFMGAGVERYVSGKRLTPPDSIAAEVAQLELGEMQLLALAASADRA